MIKKFYTTNDIIEICYKITLDKYKVKRNHIYSLLSGLLDLSTIKFFTKSNLKISEKMKKRFLKKFVTYLDGKPLSKILGTREFYSNNFFVNSEILDPRPESEILIDATINLIRNKRCENLNILELGVGSGCIIISLMKELKKFKLNIHGVGIDIEDSALETAKKNRCRHKFSDDDLQFIKSDWFSKVKGKFNIIISNPPYISINEMKLLDKSVLIYDPLVALYGGEDGLECYRKIAKSALDFLSYEGFIILEIGWRQKKLVKEIFQKKNFMYVGCLKDLAHKDRCIIFKKKNMLI